MKIELPGITLSIESITPKEAEEMLIKNIYNRPLSPRHVEFLIKEMKHGRFIFNGETIVFDPEGNLMQGQHRLHACVNSGMTITVLVVRGVSRDAFPTFDVTRPRTAADLLASYGLVKFKLVSAALRFVMQMEAGYLSTKPKFAPNEVAEAFEKHPTLLDSVEFVESNKLATPRVIAGLHYLFCQIDQVAADAFVSQIISGSGLEPATAVYSLRNQLIENLTSRSKLPEHPMAALIIKAWNAYREGKRVESIRFKRGEEFPRISGLASKTLP